MFNIKLKTKNGNPIKQKETFTVFFKMKYKYNTLTKQNLAEYTYRIMHRTGIQDTGVVYRMKENVRSIEHMTIRVLLNCVHLVGKLTKSSGINPDFVLFISPDFESDQNMSWKFLNDCFNHEVKTKNFKSAWNKENCDSYKIFKEELMLLRDFSDLNPNTKFMTIDPNRDKIKYRKSIIVCDALNDRLNRQLQLIPTV